MEENRKINETAAQTGEAKPSWEALMADPEYNGKMQETVKARLREAKDASETLRSLEPVLRELRGRYRVERNSEIPGAAIAEKAARRASLEEHAKRVIGESREMKKLYPDFDLAREMRDERFLRMTAPGTGIDVRTAYETLHGRSLAPAAMAYAVRRTEEKLAGAIRSGSLRPAENGASGSASAILRDDPRMLTPRERADIRRRVKNGERVVW